jgi:hypothetical protein
MLNFISFSESIYITKLLEFLNKYTSNPLFIVSLILQFSIYIISWGSVLVVAMINPHSFLVILEVFTSLALNLESGVFITLMIWTSRNWKKYKDIEIEEPLPNWMVYSIYFTGLYFLFACFYDIFYQCVKLFLNPMPF